MSRPVLEGLRVLDFTWVLAGPYATRLLADFGAEVIKVQPPMADERDGSFERGYYNTWNRNKMGITLNFDRPQGVALAKHLAAASDAVVENFAPRVMANLGLDYDSLKEVKPDIIMLSMSVMGQTGPWRNYAGFGPCVQAFSGLTGLTSFPGRPPAGLGFALADHVAGLTAALALLGALEYRRSTGMGQFIDLSQVEAMTALVGDAVLDCSTGEREVAPAGNSSAKAAPHNVYRCLGDDRWCAIAVFTDEEWRGFKQALDSPLWAEDDRFASAAGRRQNAAALDALISGWTESRSAEEVMQTMQGNGVPAGVVHDARSLAADPHLRARGFLVEMDSTVSDASPIRLSRGGTRYNRAAPERGQDNGYVYKELLGMTENELERLGREGVI